MQNTVKTIYLDLCALGDNRIGMQNSMGASNFPNSRFQVRSNHMGYSHIQSVGSSNSIYE